MAAPDLEELPKVKAIRKIQELCRNYEDSEARYAVAFVSDMSEESKVDAISAHAAANAAREMRDKTIDLIHGYWPVEKGK